VSRGQLVTLAIRHNSYLTLHKFIRVRLGGFLCLVDYRSDELVLNDYRMERAGASNSSARGLTRMSSVKFSQRTVPERSIRNSAGREISVPSGPPPGCRSS
jgi:hypothetical protein